MLTTPSTPPGVIVSNWINQSGAAITRNAVHVVIIQTNPGYGPDPGPPGTGTVVGIFYWSIQRGPP
jgi:hypothetical protein